MVGGGGINGVTLKVAGRDGNNNMKEAVGGGGNIEYKLVVREVYSLLLIHVFLSIDNFRILTFLG